MADNSNGQTYQRFYSSSDVQVIISDVSSQSLLTIDLATGIGFNESAPLLPVYGLASIYPSFFVEQNSLVSGFIGLSFKYEDYLKQAILHVNGAGGSSTRINKIGEEDITDFDTLKAAISRRESDLETSSGINSYQFPFNISIIVSADSIDGEFHSINISECYITGRSMSVSSDGENTLGEGFSFVAKAIQ